MINPLTWLVFLRKKAICKTKNMEITKISTTSKSIKIELKNSDNFYLDLSQDRTAEENKILFKLYTALDFIFKKGGVLNSPKNTIPLNQTNLIDQINDVMRDLK